MVLHARVVPNGTRFPGTSWTIQRGGLNPQGQWRATSVEPRHKGSVFRVRDARRARAQDKSACPERTDTPEERRRRDQADADADDDQDQVALRVVAVLERVIPSVDHLQDWRADANGK